VLAELLSFLNDHTSDLVLIEAGQANLAEVLDYFAKTGATRLSRNVALLDESVDERISAVASSHFEKQRAVVDALWEAGAADVIESPRSVHRLLELGNRIAEASALTGRVSESEPIAEWAMSLLPWQAS